MALTELPAGPIVIRTNEDWRDVLRLAHPADPDEPEAEPEPLDLSDPTTKLRMHIRRQREDAGVWMLLSTANGRLVKTEAADEGEFAFNVDRTVIASRLPPGDYIADLEVRMGDVDIVAFERLLTVVQGVTR